MSAGAILRAIARKPTFVEQACRSKELAAALGKHGLWHAPMHEAEVFVVQFPGQADVFLSAASAIRGAYQLSPKVLLSGHGVALKMKPVYHLPKTMYISPACAAGQAPFCAFLQRLMANTKDCKWKIALADWAALKQRLAQERFSRWSGPRSSAQRPSRATVTLSRWRLS